MGKASERFYQQLNDKHRAFNPDTLKKLAEEHASRTEHLWLALTTYHITGDDIELVAKTQNLPVLGADNLVSINIGCFLCDTPFAPGLIGTQCKPMEQMRYN